MKTIVLFNEEKQNLTKQVEGLPVLPQKYCPNCEQKHQVRSEIVELEHFPKGIKHVLFTIYCPDEEGEKYYGKYCAPFAAEVVNKEYFNFRKEDIL